MPERDIVVIGASAGGISALQAIVRGLPADFPAAILVVLHLSRQSGGLLPEILARAGALPASNARHNEEISAGHIYVAPPDRHLLIGPERRIYLGHGPKENRFRPAVDPLFRSAALREGRKVIGVVLSGGLDDGSAGLYAIKRAGGLAMVQDPSEAEVPSMPRNALQHVAADYCASAEKIGEMLPILLRQAPVREMPAMSEDTRLEVELAADERNQLDVTQLGPPSPYTCPACSGSLMRIGNAQPVRFRCHTGHAFTVMSLDDEQREKVENAAWSAIRALQEHALLLQEMIRLPGFSGEEIADYAARAEQALERATLLRETLAATPDKPDKD
ncbi:MAG TPA: chemotaxis protein CheB [Micropepsaceae bacterium]|nr:chemotaxis protein CheB [Micropepsaceae bacterium]